MRVLIRIWPNRMVSGQVGVQKFVDILDEVYREGDEFFIAELDRTLTIETIPEEQPDDVDLEIRLHAVLSEVHRLEAQGWDPIESACTNCLHQ